MVCRYLWCWVEISRGRAVSYTPPRILMDSVRSQHSPWSLLLDSCLTPGIVLLHSIYSWKSPDIILLMCGSNPHGVHGVHVEPPRTPPGVRGHSRSLQGVYRQNIHSARLLCNKLHTTSYPIHIIYKCLLFSTSSSHLVT